MYPQENGNDTMALSLHWMPSPSAFCVHAARKRIYIICGMLLWYCHKTEDWEWVWPPNPQNTQLRSPTMAFGSSDETKAHKVFLLFELKKLSSCHAFPFHSSLFKCKLVRMKEMKSVWCCRRLGSHTQNDSFSRILSFLVDGRLPIFWLPSISVFVSFF